MFGDRKTLALVSYPITALVVALPAQVTKKLLLPSITMFARPPPDIPPPVIAVPAVPVELTGVTWPGIAAVACDPVAAGPPAVTIHPWLVESTATEIVP